MLQYFREFPTNKSQFYLNERKQLNTACINYPDGPDSEKGDLISIEILNDNVINPAALYTKEISFGNTN